MVALHTGGHLALSGVQYTLSPREYTAPATRIYRKRAHAPRPSRSSQLTFVRGIIFPPFCPQKEYGILRLGYLPEAGRVVRGKIVKSEGEGGRLVVRRCVGPGGAVSWTRKVALGKEDRACSSGLWAGAAAVGRGEGTAAAPRQCRQDARSTPVDLNFCIPAICSRCASASRRRHVHEDGNIIVAVNCTRDVQAARAPRGIWSASRVLAGRQRARRSVSAPGHVYFVSSRASQTCRESRNPSPSPDPVRERWRQQKS